MPSIGVPASGRRQFLQVLGAGALALGRLPAADKPGKPRSEERRVGKECRSRWSPYH